MRTNNDEPSHALIPAVLAGALVLAVAALTAISGVTTVLDAHEYRNEPASQFRALAQRSTVYDAQGGTLAVLGTENREDVDIEAVPQIIKDAVVAVEDQTFWENEGIDVNGMMRAAVNSLTSGDVEGGSTITQQLVKNRILSPERDVERKMREIVLALQLNDAHSKEEILEQYLNTVYFGQGSYGVKTAVERFFWTVDEGASLPRGKRLDEVTVGEAALLAGLISNPEGNNPLVFPERARERRALALRAMLEQGYIDAPQAAAAAEEPLPAIEPVPELRPRNSWAEEVQDRLFNDPMFAVLGDTVEERRDAVLRGGLEVHATLDPHVQRAAQGAIDAILPEKPGFTGALVAMDPRNGHVKAMVAGPGFEHSQYNIATSYPGRQSGSTWKAITLAAALEHGFSPNDRVSGSSPCEFGDWGKTENAGGSRGIITLRDATVGSVNCAYARAELALGFDKIIPVAQRMGITQDTLRPILTLTLGAIESTPLEMATVGSTIANGGMRHQPVFVSKIVAPGGNVIFDSAALEPSRAISAETATCEIHLLRQVVTSGTGTAARLSGRPLIGKTGTTDSRADAAFLGATPQLAAFVWHGHAEARVPGAGFGGDVPARIFRQFMETALAGQPVADFPPPGPSCDAPGRFIEPEGRTERAPAPAPTQAPPPAPAPTTTPTQPPTTSPPSTTPPTTDGGGGGGGEGGGGDAGGEGGG